MEILTVPNPILRKRCQSSAILKLQEIGEMIRLMQQHDGIGLAAPQVGINARMFVTAWGEFFIDPEVVEASQDLYASQEGCLSIPGSQFIVMRHKWVRLRGDKRYWQGIRAAVIQHETDHLNGILISDLGKEVEGKVDGARQYLRGGRVPSPSAEPNT
jgi:peptide deformylase